VRLLEKSNPETVYRWSKSDKTPSAELFLGNPDVNVDIDDPSDIPKVLSTVTGGEIIQLFADQSNLYHRQNVNK
jgi:hypothetical protein